MDAGLGLVNYLTATCATNTASLPENVDCTSGLYGLTGEVVGNEVELFATSFTLGDDNASYLYGITDTLDDTQASEVSGETFSQLAEAPADSNFKGVALLPVPEPASFGLLGVAVAGLGLARRRQRG